MRRAMQNGRGLLGVVSSFGLALPACTPQPAARSASPDTAPALVATATEAAASPPRLDAANDHSLSMAVYRAAGVPEVDHAWSVADYQRGLDVFVELLRRDRNDLPRAGSSRSGALFARLVDPLNFGAGATPDVAERARRLHDYLGVYPGLLQVYSPANDGVDFSQEQAELITGLLELLKSSLASSFETSARDPSWTPEYEHQQVVTLGVVRGAGTLLTESERYSVDVRQRLRTELARLAPELERHLAPEAAREVHAIAFPPTLTRRDSEPLH